MKRLSHAFFALALTACPDGSPISESGPGSSDGSGAPESSGSAPDLAGPGTETGLVVGSGDGDGDGSTAAAAALVVESDGQRIGYLLGVFDYGLVVWDDVNEVVFNVSQQTGNVAIGPISGPGQRLIFESFDCTGQAYVGSEYATSGSCTITPPTRQHLILIGGSASGQVAAFPVMLAAGSPMVVLRNSIMDVGAGSCITAPSMACAMKVDPTDVIPVTFPLPITVSESPP